MIKKLMLLSGSLLSLNILGAESFPVDTIEDRDAQIRSFKEDSHEYLAVCKLGIIQQIVHDECSGKNYSLGEIEDAVRQGVDEALEQLRIIDEFAQAIKDEGLIKEASKRKRDLEMPSSKRRKIERDTKNA